MGALHQAHERQVIQGLDQVHIGQVAQMLRHRPKNIGVQMHRVNDLDIAALRQLTQGFTDIEEAVAEIFPTMPGDQQDLAVGLQEGKLLVQTGTQFGILFDALRSQLQGIDHRVASDKRAPLQAFAQQVATRFVGRGKQHVGTQIDAATVHLFRPWAVDITGTQPGFHMAHRDAAMEGTHRRDHGGRCVAMHQHTIRLGHLQHRINRPVQRSGQRVEGLVRRHHVQGEISFQIEQLQHLFKHALVLAGDADLRVDTRFCSQCLDQRSHLDGFWTCAENRQDFNP